MIKDNAVGSFNESDPLVKDHESAYILGLWCADGYYWSSSIGITNVDKRLVDRFSLYLKRFFPEERLKLRVYRPLGEMPLTKKTKSYPMRLAKQDAYQLYVNSRPLLRAFQNAEKRVSNLESEFILAYFAGRFDGDGSIDQNLRNDLRISYSNRQEAEVDQQLLCRLRCYRSRIYHYRSARTYVLYVSRYDANQFLHDMVTYSVKAQSLLPRRDSSVLGQQTDGQYVFHDHKTLVSLQEQG